VDEFLAQAYWKDKGLPVTVGRLFNTVGPRQSGRYGMVLPRFVGQALRDEPITVYGDGRQTRCFSLVGEVVDCILALLHCSDAVGRVVNVGSVQEVTIMELAETVRDRSGSGSDIVLVPYEEAYPSDFEDMRRRAPDVSLLQSLIGRAPQAGLEEIVDAVIGWARQSR
jgi:UDP-glucose 4-epimerase